MTTMEKLIAATDALNSINTDDLKDFVLVLNNQAGSSLSFHTAALNTLKQQYSIRLNSGPQ